MAQPTYYPDWATEDTTLPSTGQTNKVRPKNSLLTIGWDKGQIPSAEEFNWELNNLGQWIRYLNDEVIAGLPDVYLPKNAATSNPTPNTLVKRDIGGGFGALQNFYGYAPAGQNFDYRIYDQAASSVQKASFAWNRSADVVTLYRGTPTSKTAEVNLYSGRVDITAPRSLSAQGSNGADLTRKDYVDTQISTNISNLDNTLRSYIDSKSTASFATNGYWKDVNTGTIIQWGSITLPTISAPQTSGNVTFPITFPNAVYSITANPKVNTMNTSTGNISVLACANGTTSGFTLWADSNQGQDFSIAQPCYWIAIGR